MGLISQCLTFEMSGPRFQIADRRFAFAGLTVGPAGPRPEIAGPRFSPRGVGRTFPAGISLRETYGKGAGAHRYSVRPAGASRGAGRVKEMSRSGSAGPVIVNASPMRAAMRPAAPCLRNAGAGARAGWHGFTQEDSDYDS